MSFLSATDHASLALQQYHVFVNPSTSDVLCTATAEALAMGKSVLIARWAASQISATGEARRLSCAFVFALNALIFSFFV